MSIFFIILSTISFTLNTVPEFQRKKTSNSTNKPKLYYYTSSRKTEYKFEIIEAICISWFTIEYLLRCWSSPSKKSFFKGVLNFIDLIAIIPYFVSIFLSSQAYFVSNFNNVRRTLQFFRVLRIFRVLKLARHSIGLKSLGMTLKQSYRELTMLIMFLGIGVLLFSSLAYFAEKEHPSTKFTSIPATFW